MNKTIRIFMRTTLKLITAIILAICLSPFYAEAKNLFVNNSGSPACSDSTTYANNSASNPWCTIGRAAWGNAVRPVSWPGPYRSEAAAPGDTVFITAGNYHYAGVYIASRIDALYRLVNAIGATDWITFTTVGGNVTLTSNTAGSHVMLGGTDVDRYVKWTGGNNWFMIDQANMGFRPGAAMIMGNNTFPFYIEKFNLAGQYLSQSPGDQHVGILAQGPGGSTCTGGLNNLTIRNNKIHGFTGTSGRNDSAITMYCLGDNILIEHNDIYSNQTGIYGKSSNQQSVNVNIRFNNFYSNSGDAIAMQAFDGWHVYQNIMRDHAGGAAFHFMNTIYYQGSPKPTNTYVVNNTMDNNLRNIYMEASCENMSSNYVRNNLMTGSSRIIFTEGDVCTTPANIGTDDISFNNNLYEYSGTFWTSDGSFSSTYANWQSTYGQDTASLNNVDPVYVNRANKNYRLQPSASARNAGIDILDLDNDGQTNDPITLGAYITGNEIIGTLPTSTATAPPGAVR